MKNDKNKLSTISKILKVEYKINAEQHGPLKMIYVGLGV